MLMSNFGGKSRMTRIENEAGERPDGEGDRHGRPFRRAEETHRSLYSVS
jgi:hypothetical protein